MSFENFGTIELIVLFAVFVFGIFYARSKHVSRSGNKSEIKKQVDEDNREAKKLINLDDDLKQIESELQDQLAPSERLFDEKGNERKSETQISTRHLNLVDTTAKTEKYVSLDEALRSTKSGLMGRIRGLFSATSNSADESLESIEEVLFTSDIGPQTVTRLVEAIGEKLKSSKDKDVEVVRGALRDEMVSILEEPQKGLKSIENYFQASQKSENRPEVWMVVGVNGAGKTTTIGKLAYKLALSGKTVMIAAGDTFRAAAGEQLKVWSERAEVEIFAPEGIENPSAVAFDAIKYACSKGVDHLIIDTAGRLHTQKNLMEELKKVKRVCEKAFGDSGGKGGPAPHEILLVLDANSGQNALIQAREFHQALGVTGIVLTKLDGTAKGGVAVGISAELRIPIQLIGVGEGREDLRAFSPSEFVDAIV